MTRGLDDEMKYAIEKGDAKRLGRIVDQCRRGGATYDQLFTRARKLTGITLPEWETLMEEADEAEGQE